MKKDLNNNDKGKEENKINEQNKNDEEERINNNRYLKKQLKLLSQKIEEILSEHKERMLYSIPISKDDNNKIDTEKFNKFIQQIKEQKSKSESFREMLDYDNKFSQITKEDNEYKYVCEILEAKKKEHSSLEIIKKRLQKSVKYLLNGDFNSHQFSNLQEKCRQA